MLTSYDRKIVFLILHWYNLGDFYVEKSLHFGGENCLKEKSGVAFYVSC